MSTERKYSLIKIAKGDYLLPGNDGRTVWRLGTYTDGPSNGLTDWPRDRLVWGVWKWVGDSTVYVDTGSWERWEMHEGCLPTRAEAIESALR